MNNRIMKLIYNEDKKNPLTDMEIAEKLNISREMVTNARKDQGIENSRERRREYLIRDIDTILMEYGEISDRKLTTILNEKGYDVGRYIVGKVRNDVEKLKKAQNKNGDSNDYEMNNSMSGKYLEKDNIFSAFIGYNGSLKNQISKAQAAIMYPPKGLHTLIYGPSGVGKSFLAELMYEYALSTDNFEKNSPYYEFNCADYADNPQLLLAQLFGYSKGAFTGADEDKNGIVELCNGGILFLDEVHRLPPEGQEILFYLMDKGKFRRLGDIDAQRKSKLMIIAATTENPKSSLLLTFRRRFPINIEIPPIKERPLKEKKEFIRRFFIIESRRLGQKIYVRKEVLEYLLNAEYEGNAGQLKSDIQVCCAKSFLESKLNKVTDVVVGVDSLSESMKKVYTLQRNKYDDSKSITGDIVVFPEGSKLYDNFRSNDITDDSIYIKIEVKYDELKNNGIDEKDIGKILTEEVERSLFKHIQKVEESKFSYEEISNIVSKEILQITEEIYQIAKKRIKGLKKNIIFPLAIHINEAVILTKQNKRVFNTKLPIIKENFKEEYILAKNIIGKINKKYYINLPDEEACFLAMYFNRFKNSSQIEKRKIGLIIVSHGRVACGMAEVANAIIGAKHAIGLEMDFSDTPNMMLEKTIDMVKKVEQGKGCIILADMGSLLNLKEPIEDATGVHVEVVGRTDTLMVIECLRKILYTDETLEDIKRDLEYKKNNLIMPKKIEATKKKTILCLCITGEGAAIRIKSHLIDRLKSNITDIEILTRGYIEGKNIESIIEETEKYYDILAIIGTIDPKFEKYPFISISDIFNPDGISNLRKIIKKKTIFDKNNLSEILELDLISVNENFNYKNQVLDNAIEQLVNKSYVKPEYLLSVYKRESLSSTYLQGGIAIPHGDETLITKPAIFITKLDRPIVWDGIKTVDIIFVLAIDENSKKYFEQLYKIISNEALITSIRQTSQKEQILDILCKNT